MWPHELGVNDPQHAWSAPIPIHSQSIGRGPISSLGGAGVRNKEGPLALARIRRISLKGDSEESHAYHGLFIGSQHHVGNTDTP